MAFKQRGGNCAEIEALQRYCLNKAGYKAYMLIVNTISSWADAHAVTKFYDKGNMYIMDNGKRSPLGIRGPLKNIREAGYSIQGIL